MSQTLQIAESELRDDVIVPFRTVASGISGRLVRLGPLVHDLLSRHDYPAPVAAVMGEAFALTALLGSTMKHEGRLIVQTRTDGPLGFFVTNYQVPGMIRGYGKHNPDVIKGDSAFDAIDHGELLGSGHLALTIDPGGDMDRYQGIVAMEGTPLSDAALNYFRQSEQLPTFIRLTVAQSVTNDDTPQWRAAGIMVQHVAPDGGKPPPENAPDDFLLGDDDDHWQRVAALAATVEDHELLDPLLTPERLLFRLFHEEGVRVMDDQALSSFCQCSRDRVTDFLATFGRDQLDDLRTPDGGVSVTCEFCKTEYRYSKSEIDG